MRKNVSEGRMKLRIQYSRETDLIFSDNIPQYADWLENKLADKQIDEGRCLYAFRYIDCFYEGNWVTVSIHYSKDGAEKAMNEHKNKQLAIWNETFEDDYKMKCEFGKNRGWDVKEVEVLP